MSKRKYPQQNPEPAKKATAPYNFIPIPEQVIPAEDGRVTHDTYHTRRHTGQITATLKTVSPLYTRTGLSPEEFAAMSGQSFDTLSPEHKQRYAEFFQLNRVPAIPGSSIRGMLRTLIEIVTQSKLTRVMQEKPFFRTLTDPATKDIYYNYFLKDRGKVEHRSTPRANCYQTKVHAGYFRYTPKGVVIEECEWGRIERRDIPGASPNPPDHGLYAGKAPNMTPKWEYQYKTFFVKLDPEDDHFFPKVARRHPDLYLHFRKVSQASNVSAAGLQEAMLVITGNIKHKKLEFVFLKPIIKTYPISDNMVRRFHDDDQITQWQQDAFPEERSSDSPKHKHKNDGKLKDGDPVFFLLDDQGQVIFFGRTQNFRLPYPHAPHDFVPPDLRNPNITDIAEAMFGYVPVNDGERQDKRQAYAGRVFVDDALLVEAQRNSNVWLDLNGQNYLVPQILSSPKPTTFQHYLVQPPISNTEKQRIRNEEAARARNMRKEPRNYTDEEIERMLLKHYACEPVTETIIRGYKLYWHKGMVNAADVKHPTVQPGSETKQHTGLCPVKPDTRFSLSIRFENLSDVELGALLWLLQLASNSQYALKLGMGKPLGLGSVQIEDLAVQVSDRCARYTQLFNDTGAWKTGMIPWDTERQQKCVTAFQAHIVQHSGEDSVSDFERLPRTQTLRCMLAWPGSNLSQTRYMELSKFRDRPILPPPCTNSQEGEDDTE